MATQKIREPHGKYQDKNFSRTMLTNFVLKFTKIVFKYLNFFLTFFFFSLDFGLILLMGVVGRWVSFLFGFFLGGREGKEVLAINNTFKIIPAHFLR